MTPPIDRVRYYDGEYLRAFDFTDEQTYHMEMRRRLNMALHLWGIVEGLEITSDTEAKITQYSIQPGMAIDPFGREILMFAPYVLDETVLGTNRISNTGYYGVWIRYRKQEATPPSAGYASCNGSSQYTRWQEGFDVLILPRTTNLNAPILPAPTDPQSDDPATDGMAVPLGVIHVTSSGGAVSIDNFSPVNRSYVGIQAQRIICPTTPTGFNILNQQDALDPPASLDVQSNVFIDQNLIVGGDFTIDPTKIQPSPSGGPTGNVKVTGDLFVNGNVYTSSGPQWLTPVQQVQNALPDIQLKSIEISPTYTLTDPSSDTVPITITSNLPTVRSATALAMLTGLVWLSPALFVQWFTNSNVNNDAPVQVSAGLPTPVSVGSTTWTIPVTWSVGPVATGAGIPPLPIKSINVGLIVVFLP